jgi:hypothetical protein
MSLCPNALKKMDDLQANNESTRKLSKDEVKNLSTHTEKTQTNYVANPAMTGFLAAIINDIKFNMMNNASKNNSKQDVPTKEEVIPVSPSGSSEGMGMNLFD